MQEPEANSEAEEAYDGLEIELLAIIASALLATSSFDSKTLNATAQDVYREVNSKVANSKQKLDMAALNDLIGTCILDAIQVSAMPDVDPKYEQEQAEKEAAKAYKRYTKDAAAIQKGIVVNSRRAYLDAARKAAHNVDRIGTKQAVKDAVVELAQRGITCYEYTRKDGVIVQVPVDVGIRRAIKSNDNLQDRATATLHAAARTTGLVEVSTTAGARKSHAKWQGKVYQLEGSSKEYPNFYKACKWGDPVDGILGYNCGHRFRPYYPAMGKQYKDPLEGTDYTNEQVRELKTTQRKYENDIRKLKREREVLRKCGLDTKDVNVKIKAKEAQLNKFIDDNSQVLRRERWRETIYEKARKEADTFGVVSVDEKKIKRAADKEAYKVNIKHIDTKRYKKKVRSAVGKDAEEGAYKAIHRMLIHRNETAMEDLYAIDLSNGRVISSILNSKEEQRVVITSKFQDAMTKAKSKGKEIALIHNHPGSSMPSAGDIESFAKSGASMGIVACHDGTIYKYRKVKEHEPGYNIKQERINSVMMLWGNRPEGELFERIKERFGIEIERLT